MKVISLYVHAIYFLEELLIYGSLSSEKTQSSTTYVTGPAKINHVSTNYTLLGIHEYLQF